MRLGVFGARRCDARLSGGRGCWVAATGCCRSGVTAGGGGGGGSGVDGGQSGGSGGGVAATGCGSIVRAYAVIVARPEGRVAILSGVSQGAVQGVESGGGDVLFLCKCRAGVAFPSLTVFRAGG